VISVTELQRILSDAYHDPLLIPHRVFAVIGIKKSEEPNPDLTMLYWLTIRVAKLFILGYDDT
jgi:hypothetical protein